MTVTRAGFETADLDVTIGRGTTFATTVTLQATADTRDAYLSRIHDRHVWGWSLTGAGVAALATGVALFVTGRSALNSANANFDAVNMEFVRHSGQPCDPAIVTNVTQPMCTALFDNANQRVTDANTRLTVSYIVGGVGAAAAIVGTVLLLTGDNPARYDRKSAASARPSLLGWVGGGGGGLVLLGRF